MAYDHGGVEALKPGSGKLEGKKAAITGGDSGIGRAVALAFAREGADILIAYLCEDDDANESKRLVEDAGRKAVLVRGGGIDIPVNSSGKFQINRRYFRRGMGEDLQGQHPRHVLPDKGSSATHDERRRDHQHSLDQC